MTNSSRPENQILEVNNFNDLVSTPFQGEINAICWNRDLTGDFSEIILKLEVDDNIIEVDLDELRALDLSDQGQLAREVLLNDLKLLKDHGASPSLNIINYYDRDDAFLFFPTDVYSFHVDRSPIPGATFLCTYFGEASEIIPNSEVEQKILVSEIREELLKLYGGKEGKGFEVFLEENFFDLHYQVKADGKPVNLGLGHIWRLAIDHPESEVLPCVHRAPKEKEGESRLLLIC